MANRKSKKVSVPDLMTVMHAALDAKHEADAGIIRRDQTLAKTIEYAKRVQRRKLLRQ